MIPTCGEFIEPVKVEGVEFPSSTINKADFDLGRRFRLNPALSEERAGTRFLWPCGAHLTGSKPPVKLTFCEMMLLSEVVERR